MGDVLSKSTPGSYVVHYEMCMFWKSPHPNTHNESLGRVSEGRFQIKPCSMPLIQPDTQHKYEWPTFLDVRYYYHMFNVLMQAFIYPWFRLNRCFRGWNMHIIQRLIIKRPSVALLKPAKVKRPMVYTRASQTHTIKYSIARSTTIKNCKQVASLMSWGSFIASVTYREPTMVEHIKIIKIMQFTWEILECSQNILEHPTC